MKIATRNAVRYLFIFTKRVATPNDLKLTDAPEKQREALGGDTSANAASHDEAAGGKRGQAIKKK